MGASVGITIRSPIRRFKRRRAAITMITLVVLVGLVIADRAGWLLIRQSDDLAAYHGVSAKVVRVIDGDTLEVDLPDALNHRPATRVRLWGIDCPEAANFGKPAQPWADDATALATSLCDQQIVILKLEYDRPRDSFSRVLAHVELNDGRVLNETLLEAGFAKADDRWPHSRLVRYAQVEMAARKQKIGLWSRATGDQ